MRRAESRNPTGCGNNNADSLLYSESMGSPFDLWRIQPCCLGFVCYLFYTAAYLGAATYQVCNLVSFDPLLPLSYHGCTSSLGD